MMTPMERGDWNRRYAAPEFIWAVEANHVLVAEVVDLLPGRALDRAAGEGRNTVWWAEQGWTVRAVVPGGTFLVVGQVPANPEHGCGDPQDPGVLYTAEQVVAASGGETLVEKAGHVEQPVETEGGVKVAIKCLVRGRRP
ncbi:hypothetical protein [Azospirillum soli]|uniref:hypothetical protein n=1 Tax=Azospirillum soli TaxID=1304799 RepID=UPI001AE5EB87|nr:hypothetical protein [Azospirillum soli]MBP2316939.1 hypothetical protein [Azospirillum soli]